MMLLILIPLYVLRSQALKMTLLCLMLFNHAWFMDHGVLSSLVQFVYNVDNVRRVTQKCFVNRLLQPMMATHATGGEII